MEISLVPVIIAIFLNMMIGMSWYSLKAFGRRWAKELGFDPTQLKATSLHYAGAMGVNAITVIVTASLIDLLHIDTLVEAVKFGSLVWLGFIAPIQFSGVLWAKKPLKVFFIDAGYWLVITLVNTLLLALWK